MDENYPSIADYAKNMSLVIGMAFVLISSGGGVFFRSMDSVIFSAGVALTALTNVLKVYWLKHSVEKSARVDATYAVNYLRVQGHLRNLLVLAVLVGAGFLSQLEVLGLPFLIGAVTGVFTMQIAALSMGFFTRKDYKNEGANTDV